MMFFISSGLYSVCTLYTDVQPCLIMSVFKRVQAKNKFLAQPGLLRPPSPQPNALPCELSRLNERLKKLNTFKEKIVYLKWTMVTISLETTNKNIVECKLFKGLQHLFNISTAINIDLSILNHMRIFVLYFDQRLCAAQRKESYKI